MSLSATTLDALLAAGATAEMIVAAVKAEAAADEARLAEKRAKAAAKKRRQRSSPHVPGTSGDTEGQGGTERDNPLPLPSSPQTPQQPTPTPENNTPARKARPAKPAEHPGLDAVWGAATPASKNRSGRDETNQALIAALEAGATLEAVVASVREHCRTGGDHAKGLHRILNAKLWRDHLQRAEAPASPVKPEVEAGRRLHFQKTGEWRSEWGPRPSPTTEKAA